MGSMVRRKFEKQLNREGINVANCTVRRIMKGEGLSGARRGRQFKITTTSNEHQYRPSDLVDRVFVAPAPNRLWVADLTYVKTHSGWVYVAFIIDVFSRFIVGWQISTSLRSDLAIDALEMAIYGRNGNDLSNLVHHSDRGSQGEFNWSSQHSVTMEVFSGSSTTSSGSGRASKDEVAGASASPTRDRANVLDRDYQRSNTSRSGTNCWRFATGRAALVPQCWGNATFQS
jgi:putative transposase